MTEEPSIDNKLEYFTIFFRKIISIPDKKSKNGIVIFFFRLNEVRFSGLSWLNRKLAWVGRQEGLRRSQDFPQDL